MEADSIVFGLIRHLSSFLAAWLVKKGYVEASLTEAVIGTVIGVTSLAWSIFNKIRTRIALNTALQLPPGATKGDLIEALKAPEVAATVVEDSSIEDGAVLADEAIEERTTSPLEPPQ